MKRTIATILTVIMIFALISCNQSISDSNTTTSPATSDPTQHASPDHLSMIYEVDGTYSYHGSNAISSAAIESVSDTADREIILELAGASRHLDYQRTLYYPIGEETVHQYLVEGESNGSILLNQDGSLHSLLYTFTALKISKNDSPEQILPLLKAELQKWVDLEQYEHIELPEANDDANGFGTYNFRFYNQVAGYRTDYVMVAVNSSGAVFGCKIRKLPVDNISLNIDKTLEQEYIELKMKDIYATSVDYEYKANSSKQCFTPQVKLYNQELCIQYSVSATLIQKQSGSEMSSFIRTILIPVRLITASETA